MNASAASVYARLLRVKRERDEQAVRDRRDAKFEVLGSKFRKPRTSNSSPSRPSRFSRNSCGGKAGGMIHHPIRWLTGLRRPCQTRPMTDVNQEDVHHALEVLGLTFPVT